MSTPRALLLVGSARPRGTGNSEVLGTYLLARLSEGGMDGEMHHVSHYQRPEKERELFAAVDAAHLFILSTPLYVDSLPYLVTGCFERLAAHRARVQGGNAPRFFAMVNCGFPELEHTRTALEICQVFARQAGFESVGGLGLGGGEALGGKPLESLGEMVRHVRRGLDLAAEALLDGQPVPEEAQALLARPMIPSRVYTFLGNIGWVRTARRLGTVRRLGDRPLP